MKNSFGNSLTVTLFGESHGEYIGAVLDGIAPGIKIDREYINNKLWLTAFKPTLTPFVPMRNEECIFACHIEECTNDKLVLFYRFKNCPHSGRMIFTVKNEKLTASFNPICGSMYEGAKVLNGHEI